MWSFHIYFDFNEFLDFLHSETVELENGVICKFIITYIEIKGLGFSDQFRGHYLVEFNLYPLQQQLTLF